MNTSLDKEFFKLNKQGLSHAQIAEKLSLSSSIHNNFETYLAYCSFLMNCGLYEKLYQSILQRIDQKQRIPWFYLFLLIQKFELEIDSNHLLRFFKSSKKDFKFLLTSSCCFLEEITSTLKESLDKIYNSHPDPQIQIEKELKFCQSQKLFQKEEELLKKLLEIDNKNPYFQQKYIECRKAKAQQVLMEYKYAYTPLVRAQNFTSPLEETKTLEKLLPQLKQYAQSHPRLKDDIAVMLANFPNQAIEFLEQYLENFSRQWFFLNLLLESKQFIHCLTYVEKFLLESPADSNNTFTLSYIKAQAYCGLDEHKKAIEILKNLLTAQPNHDSAKELLSHLESMEEVV